MDCIGVKEQDSSLRVSLIYLDLSKLLLSVVREIVLAWALDVANMPK